MFERSKYQVLLLKDNTMDVLLESPTLLSRLRVWDQLANMLCLDATNTPATAWQLLFAPIAFPGVTLVLVVVIFSKPLLSRQCRCRMVMTKRKQWLFNPSLS
jgi:hypothetical protein